MGIELELHSGRPTRKGSPRETLLRGSYEQCMELTVARELVGASLTRLFGGRGAYS